MTVAIAKWTLEEYHRMIETGLLDNRNVELIKGEIVEMAPEGKPHAHFSTESGNFLNRLLGDRAMIRPAKPITLPNQSEPEPDIAIVKPLGREYLTHHPYPEDIFWVIEYSDSTLAKDLNLKSAAYAEVNIPEYWIVNLKTLSLIVFRNPKEGRYQSRTEYTEGSLSAIAFPDVAIPISRLVSEL